VEATGTHQEPEASQRVPHDGHTPPESRFRPDIEGLRAVAVLAVVLFHAGIPGLDGGFVGVDVFFVISGFLITGLLWREATATGTIRFRNFYGARARRLLPASATVGVVTMVAAALLLPAMQVKSVAMDGITSALYVSNYWFIGSGVNYFGKESLLARTCGTRPSRPSAHTAWPRRPPRPGPPVVSTPTSPSCSAPTTAARRSSETYWCTSTPAT